MAERTNGEGMRAAILHAFAGAGGPTSAVSVEFETRGDRLWLRYVVEGSMDAVVWPAPTSGGRADGLWAHTCFEAFVAAEDGYHEFNLSPSGQWASYRFSGYREGMRPADKVVHIDGLNGASNAFALEGEIDLPRGAARLGLSAVVEASDGALSYWALAHPSDKPDFHHPASFILDLP